MEVPENSIIVGIDASRNRSGGARAHLLGILSEFNSSRHSIAEIHIWSYRELLDDLPDFSWLHKHYPPLLERTLIEQLWWQLFMFEREAKGVGCDIVFSASGSTLSRFTPMVVLSQDLLSYERGVMSYFGFGWSRLRLLTILFVQNFAFRRADGVIFLTEYAARVVQASSGALARVAHIPHGVGESFRQVALRTRPIVDGSKIVCTYVSNAAMYKHHWKVVEAIACLRKDNPDLRLVLVGGGKGRAQQLLDDAVERFDPLRQFVTQIDFVSQNELIRYLGESDIFIFASSCESLPITLLEGMAAGLPIACSNRGPMPDVLKDAGVFFDPHIPSSIADAVRKLIADPELRRLLASRASTLAENYTWSRCSFLTFDYIEKTHRHRSSLGIE